VGNGPSSAIRDKHSLGLYILSRAQVLAQCRLVCHIVGCFFFLHILVKIRNFVGYYMKNLSPYVCQESLTLSICHAWYFLYFSLKANKSLGSNIY
jgi:hypothetical protein